MNTGAGLSFPWPGAPTAACGFQMKLASRSNPAEPPSSTGQILNQTTGVRPPVRLVSTARATRLPAVTRSAHSAAVVPPVTAVTAGCEFGDDPGHPELCDDRLSRLADFLIAEVGGGRGDADLVLFENQGEAAEHAAAAFAS